MGDVWEMIYETLSLSDDEVLELIGASSIHSVKRRRELVRLFLKDSRWNLAEFKAFSKQQYLNGWFSQEQNRCIDSAPTLPKKTQMLKHLITAGLDAAKTGLRTVDQAEQQRRRAICTDRCQWYRHKDDRCAKCGCFVSFKSRLEAWHCPEKLW
jgi:hypothetical protein